MNYHIVRTNETLDKIAMMYNLTIEEIKSINAHIRNWVKLVPGTKLRLPEIPELLNEELNDVEPFIEDYYPKLNIDQIKHTENQEFEKPITPVMGTSVSNQEPISPPPQSSETVEQSEPTPKSAQPKATPTPYPYPYYPYNPYYPYGFYGYPYNYYPYQMGYRFAWPKPMPQKGQKPSS